MKSAIQDGFVNPAALEWTRANYGLSALSVHERAISMLRAQAQRPPTMQLDVNGGAYSYNGVTRLFAGGQSPEFTAPASGTRLDVLYLDGASGNLAIQQGTAAVAITDPLELPSVPSGSIPLVAVHLAAGQTEIVESDLYDLRAFVAVMASPIGYMLYEHRTAAGTSGGSFSSGSWVTRPLTDEVFDTHGDGSLASNQITLVAGTYLIRARAVGHRCGRHQVRLYNATDSSVIAYGVSERTDTSTYISTDSLVETKVTITASKAIELQHRCKDGRVDDGLGLTTDFGEINVFAQVEITRLA